MALNLIRKNSSSPFHLQRSMVDQGGEGGAYESGGYNPDATYNNDAANAAIESFGKVVGAGLSSRTEEDKNKSNEKKAARLERRGVKTEAKKQEALKSGNIDKADRMADRGKRVEGRLKSTKAEIDTYKKNQNPSVKATITTDVNSKKEETKKAESTKTANEIGQGYKASKKKTEITKR